MLCELSIRDFATISSVRICFGPGLNLLTGETGAGKSILIGALNLILGGRASVSDIRSGADRTQVSCLFKPAGDWDGYVLIRELGIELESDGSFWLQRDVFRDGRNRCSINGEPQPVAMLKKIADGLVDVLGQHEHQSLTQTKKQLSLLDSYGGHRDSCEAFQAAYQRVSALKSQVSDAERDATKEHQRHELLAYQLQELDAASLVTGEEDRLETSILKLQHAEQLRTSALEAFDKLYAQENAVIDVLQQIARKLTQLIPYDQGLSRILELINDASPRLEEAAYEARAFSSEIELDSDLLSVHSERLNFIRQIKRKYGRSIPEIIDYHRQIAQELKQHAAWEQRIEQLRSELSTAENWLSQTAVVLSQKRIEASRRLEDELTNALKDLGLEHAAFRAQTIPVNQERGIGSTGMETVEFLFSANPGEDLKPLAKVASGGELSRIMLALKRAFVIGDRTPTLIFDEVDAGIGGRTAELVARSLSLLGRNRQVLCITHLPVIAAKAHTHLLIQKVIDGGRTTTTVAELDESQRISELVRMLGGSVNDHESERFARALLLGSAD